VNVNIEANKIALAEEEETNAAMRVRMADYMARTGLAIPDFAQRIGYSGVTVRHFLNGIYHNISRSAHTLVARASAYMEQYPIAPPTRITGDLYDTANVRIIRQTFEKLMPRPVAYMIYAPPGSQKSFVLENEVARLNLAELAIAGGRRAFYVYARQNIRPRDLIRRVAIACGCRSNNDVDPMLAGIRFEFRNHRVVLVVDEAQHLSIECFETLRELLDQPPYFSLLFSGSHDLKRKFDEFSATLEQWNSRIIAKVRLPGLERLEAVGIIEREIGELLQTRTPREAKSLTDKLIAGATARDAFEKNEPYINVRTLCNALEQIKASAPDPAPAELSRQEAVA
jgi:DNA transposition AAA+ family ATPase